MDSAEYYWNSDTDGDGKINALDPDSDNDGLTDGTEMGVTEPIPSAGLIKGTDVSAYMDPGGYLRKNFTEDSDPSTKTNMTLNDTDDDGLCDGWEDDGDGVFENGIDTKGEDLNYDGYRDSTELDPLDKDTDDDGLTDLYNLFGIDYEGYIDSDDDGIIDGLEPDSDDDGLYDGLELSFPVAWLKPDTDLSAGHYINDECPGFWSRSDPQDPDSDDDGIKDGIEDADHNGAIDGDTDNDYNWDEEETWFETNPKSNDTDSDGLYDGDNGNLSEGEYAEDKDNDGTVDSDETDPIKRDSDGDSIDDGEEMIPGEDGYTCNPLKRDTDNDGLTDGQEVNGWSVATQWGDTKKPMMDPWDVQSDPNKVDTEDDGLTDFEEFNNGTDPNRSDTDYDGLTDYEEACFWEAFPIFAQMYGLNPKTMDLENPSSPIQFDKQPPFIKYVDVNTYKKDNKYYVEISGVVIDIFGIDWISTRMEGHKWKQSNLYGEQVAIFEESFSASFDRLFWDGYDIWVKSCDMNGNEAKYKTHLEGKVEKVVNVIMKILSVIASVITELVSLFLDFIWRLIGTLMNVVLKPVRNTIDSYIKDMKELCNKCMNSNSQDVPSEFFMDFIDLLFFSLFGAAILAIAITIFAIECIVKVITLGAGELIFIAVGALISLIVICALGFSSDGDDPIVNSGTSLFDNVKNLIGWEEEQETKGKGIARIVANSIALIALIVAIIAMIQAYVVTLPYLFPYLSIVFAISAIVFTSSYWDPIEPTATIIGFVLGLGAILNELIFFWGMPIGSSRLLNGISIGVATMSVIIALYLMFTG